MRVTFLGTGTSTGVPVPTCDCRVCTSPDPRDRRLRPAVLLEWSGASVLVDTPTDLREQVLRHDVRRIDAVLFTHAHADHMLGLDELRVFNWRQGGPIPAYGSALTLAMLSRTFWYVFDGVPPESTKPVIQRREIDGPFELHGRQVVPVELHHGRMPILGFRIGNFAYLTDVSTVPPSSYALLSNLDVLVLNALRERPHPTHLTLAQALAEAERIAPRRVLFTHVSHELLHAEIEARLPAFANLAYDGLRLEIDD